jgi:hypothetical protein
MGMFNTQRDKDILMASLQFAGVQGNAAASKAFTELLNAGHKAPSVGAGGIMNKGSFIQPAAPPPAKQPSPFAPITAAPTAALAGPVSEFTHVNTPRDAVKNISSWSNSYFKKAHDYAKASGFAIDEVEAAAIAAYTGSTYDSINAAQRNNALTKDQALYINAMKSGLSKMPKFVGVTKRGTTLSKKAAEFYKPGFVVREPAFMSTSPTKPWAGNTRFEIHSLTGVHVRELAKTTGHETEDEVIMPPGQVFVVSNGPAKGFDHYIVLQEVPKAT